MRISDWSSDVCSSDLRATTTDGRQVAVKVLRPGIEKEFARDIETYEWAAAQIEAQGGEIARLRPRLVIETFKRWTARELDLRREAASASELAQMRSEEHTSELQSLMRISYAVFCLKKKKHTKQKN